MTILQHARHGGTSRILDDGSALEKHRSTKTALGGSKPSYHRMKVYRSAITGEFVTEEYAKEHPDTTVEEEVEDDE